MNCQICAGKDKKNNKVSPLTKPLQRHCQGVIKTAVTGVRQRADNNGSNGSLFTRSRCYPADYLPGVGEGAGSVILKNDPVIKKRHYIQMLPAPSGARSLGPATPHSAIIIFSENYLIRSQSCHSQLPWWSQCYISRLHWFYKHILAHKVLH